MGAMATVATTGMVAVMVGTVNMVAPKEVMVAKAAEAKAAEGMAVAAPGEDVVEVKVVVEMVECWAAEVQVAVDPPHMSHHLPSHSETNSKQAGTCIHRLERCNRRRKANLRQLPNS